VDTASAFSATIRILAIVQFTRPCGRGSSPTSSHRNEKLQLDFRTSCEFNGRRYFFMVPPRVVASPFLSAEPAVLAPCVLASFEEGIELAPLAAPVLLELPPVVGEC
jgi:hypothetical protein